QGAVLDQQCVGIAAGGIAGVDGGGIADRRVGHVGIEAELQPVGGGDLELGLDARQLGVDAGGRRRVRDDLGDLVVVIVIVPQGQVGLQAAIHQGVLGAQLIGVHAFRRIGLGDADQVGALHPRIGAARLVAAGVGGI